MTSILVVLIPLIASPVVLATKTVHLRMDDLYENVNATYPNPPAYIYKEGMAGSKVYCKVYVANTGSEDDTYSLRVIDNVWPTSWVGDNTSIGVPAGKYEVRKLAITIPSNANIGDNDNIKVRATGTGVTPATSENNVIARASMKIKPANEDVYTRSDIPDLSTDNEGWGGKPESMYIGLYTGGSLGDSHQQAFLQFDLRGIKPGFNVANARLMVYCYSGYPYDGDQGTYSVYWTSNDSWVEENVTWNNNPGYENVVVSKHLQELPRYADNWIDFDITSIVNWERENGNNILSLCIRNPDADAGTNQSISIRAKEYYDLDKHPYLDIGGKSVIVSSDPITRRAFREGTFYYTVSVKNLNAAAVGADNYNLTVSDNAGWNPKLEENRFVNVAVGQTVITRFYATAPLSAPINAENVDKFTVTCKSDDNAAVATDMSWASVVDNILYPPDDDAQVSVGAPDNNYGLETSMYIRSGDNVTGMPTTGNERGFIKYDLRGLPPENLNITSAKLYIWNFNALYSSVNVQVCLVDYDNWAEENLTWNNMPAFGNVIDNVYLTQDSDNQWYSWDVTSYVANQRKYGDNIASFLLKAEIENQDGAYSFDCKEWKNENERPYLKIALGTAAIRKVDASISPVHRVGDNGVTENFTVTVMNKGNVIDNYTLENTDNSNWSKILTPVKFDNVRPSESRTATLTVTLSTTPGAQDNIKVKVSGTGVSDNENCSASVKKNNSWVVAGYSPQIDNYGVAVVGAGNYIYVANSDNWSTRANFMRYDTATGQWTYLSNPPYELDNNRSPFKNGTVLAWDKSNYIYALLGGAYGDNADNSRARHYFSRYNIATNTWENLKGTGNTENENIQTGAQGSGDALAIKIGSDSIYAIVGNKNYGSYFMRYSIASNTWTTLSLPAGWTSTDDGCSMVYTGGDNLYAFQGAAGTGTKFARYTISTLSWNPMADAPSGVNDGGSLLWMSGDNIYALLGQYPVETPSPIPRDNCFYVYKISGNTWTQLENLPLGIGDPNGPRMASTVGNIYVWRGPCNPTKEYNSVLWVYATPFLFTGTVSIALLSPSGDSIYSVTVNVSGDFGMGSKLFAKFYTYSGGGQDNTLVDNENIPGHVTLNKHVSRPTPTNAIQRLDLVVTDSGGTALGTIKTWATSHPVLIARLGYINGIWPFLQENQKLPYIIELGAINGLWPFSPETYADP
jgi:hypothetical protein